MAKRKPATRPAEPDEDPNERACYASPPCFMHELDPSYLGLVAEGEPKRKPARRRRSARPARKKDSP